jgi:pimeloyl-ACP methyl ester carboxylesterase
VDAGGHRLRMLVAGAGPLAVVFESGWPGGIGGWEEVRAEVARFACVVSYDRAGIGESDPGPQPRDALRIASELHTALHSAGVEPPYVLVGHSMGGPYIRVFASQYPADVAGMVLVDPTMPESFERLQDVLAWLKARCPEKISEIEIMLDRTPEGFRAGLASAMKHIEQYVAKQPVWRRSSLRDALWEHLQEKVRQNEGRLRWMPREALGELAAVDATVRQTLAAWPLPEVPIVLLTGVRVDRHKDPEVRLMELAARREALAEIERWLAQVPAAEHVETQKCGHNIPTEEPALVVEAIKRVIDRAGGLRRVH